MADIDIPAKPKPGSYLFEVPGKSASIYVSLDVIDRLQQDVMRGFGAVPKRGAEVGGILLGSASQSNRLLVDIEDYEMVVIEYKRGPSYQLSPADVDAFEEALNRLRNSPEGLKPVGFFRSHTRDGTGLAPDDVEMLNKYFPGPAAVVLIVKPYATRVSTATFLVRENGEFPMGAPALEFPFRRKDLAPDDDTVSTRSRSGANPSPHLVGPGPGGFAAGPRGDSARHPNDLSLVRHREQGRGTTVATDASGLEAAESEAAPATTGTRSGWVWIPFSFIFLLLGVLLGFQAALTLRPQAAAGSSDPFNLQLTVSKEGDNLNVRWDRQGLAVRTASHGLLMIVDGDYNKTVDLDSNQLQTGSVVYRHSSGEVQFRLEVFPRGRDMLVETIDWKE